MALKEIRLEYEEGAPCTAIREGDCADSFCHWESHTHTRLTALCLDCVGEPVPER